MKSSFVFCWMHQYNFLPSILPLRRPSSYLRYHESTSQTDDALRIKFPLASTLRFPIAGILVLGVGTIWGILIWGEGGARAVHSLVVQGPLEVLGRRPPTRHTTNNPDTTTELSQSCGQDSGPSKTSSPRGPESELPPHGFQNTSHLQIDYRAGKPPTKI